MLKRVTGLYKEAYAGLPRGAWILALADFINRCGFMVLVFLNLYLTQKLRFSLPRAGQVLGAYGLGSLLGSYLGGHLTDRIGARAVMLFSLISSGILLIATGYVRGFIPLAAVLLVYGVVSSALFPANDTAMAGFCAGEMRVKGFALRRLAANMGITFGPVVGGFLILLDYRWLFWIDGLTTLASAVVVALWVEIRPAFPVVSRDLAAAAASVRARSPWKDAPFLAFMGLLLIMLTVFSQLFSTFNLYLNTRYGLPENRIGPLWAVNTVMIVVIEMVLLHALRKRNEMKIIALGACFIGTGFALLPLGRGFLFAAFTVAVWTMGEILTMPLTSTVASHRAGAAAGRYMGLLSLTFSLSMLIAPLAGNWLYGEVGGDILWPIAGGTAILTALGFWALSRSLTPPKSSASETPVA
ncbi:MAG: MFS transporter [Candidatus Aminicenantales bacterium]